MSSYETLIDLLVSQPPRKLRKLEASTVQEIERLGGELKTIREAMARQGRERETVAPRPKRKPTNSNGLSRGDVLAHVIRMNKPTFRPADVRDYLLTQGIDRRVEAVRNSLVRLVDDGHLERAADGKSFALPPMNGNGNGAKVETDSPGRESVLDSQAH
jgi:hypothetical protein